MVGGIGRADSNANLGVGYQGRALIATVAERLKTMQAPEADKHMDLSHASNKQLMQ